MTVSELNEMQALNNAAKSTKIEGLTVHKKFNQDKRKTKNIYFLNLGNNTLSPNLDYKNLNHFILGLSKGIKLNK